MPKSSPESLSDCSHNSEGSINSPVPESGVRPEALAQSGDKNSSPQSGLRCQRGVDLRPRQLRLEWAAMS
jgi:hypothetical protein